MAKARIDIIGDAGSFIRSIRLSRTETREFRGDLDKLSISVAKTASAEVRAAGASADRLRAKARAYRELAATAERGSREQITATNLAAQAEGRLARSITLTRTESNRLNATAGRFGRSISRGAREGEGALRRLRRAAGFGLGFLVAGGIGVEAKEIVSTAAQAQAASGQFKQAAKDVGASSGDTTRQLDQQLETQRRLGFSNLDSAKSLATLERATRDTTLARKAQLLVDDIARGRNIALTTVTNAVSRAYGGQTGALRRLVPFIKAGATATEAIAQTQKAYAGSAERYSRTAAGAQARVTAQINATEESISEALLPTITDLSNGISHYLGKAENQRKLQHDVASTFHDLATIARVVVGIIRAAAPVVQTLNSALGGTDQTIKILVGSMLAFKATKLLDGLTAITGGAKTAEGELSLLQGRIATLRKIAALGAIVLTITVLEQFIPSKITKGGQKILDSEGLGFLGRLPIVGPVVKAGADLGRATGKGLGINYGDGTSGAIPKQYDTKAERNAYIDGFNGDPMPASGSDKGGLLTAAWLAGRTAGIKKKGYAAWIAGSGNTGTAGKTGTAGGTTTTPAPKPGLTADQKNALALATAKTDTQKLAALVDERRLLAVKIAAIRTKLKTARGSQADLLIADLTSAEQEDTSAFTQIQDIEARAAAKKKAAASAAATAARKAAADYATAVATHAQRLANAAAKTSTIAATRRAYAKLIAYYRNEAADEKLTDRQRARYAADAIAARKHLVQQIAKDKAALAKATETKQLRSLGIDAGTSISDLVQRIKDAADAKQQGLPGSGSIGTPTVKALRTEAQQVTAALKNTYLDTNVSRNVLSKIRTLLKGQLGSLNADMRGKIHQLLQSMKGELTAFDGFNLTAAEKRRRSLDRRFADRYGTNRAGLRSTSSSSQPPQYHWHFEPHIEAIVDEPLGRALDRSFFKMRAAVGGA